MNQSDTKSRAKAIIEDAVNSVFITLDDNGFPHPRTMWTAGVDDDFTTYFVTGRNLAKCEQIQRNPKVCLFWTQSEGKQIGWDYTHIKGEASISDDQSLRDRFWNDALAEYFPQGRDDPNYVVITVKPKQLMLMEGHKYPLEKIEF